MKAEPFISIERGDSEAKGMRLSSALEATEALEQK